MHAVRRGEGGQSTVELALLFTFLMMPLVFGMIEMGYVLSSHMVVTAASREGARMGSNLANGGGDLGCGAGQSPNWTAVDPQIIASVERSLTGSGSLIALADVTQIRIYLADADGNETPGEVNVWTYSAGGGPVVDGDALDFAEASAGWTACERDNVIPADHLGVSVRYLHRAKGPIGSFLPGLATFTLTDRTVMALNATK